MFVNFLSLHERCGKMSQKGADGGSGASCGAENHWSGSGEWLGVGGHLLELLDI